LNDKNWLGRKYVIFIGLLVSLVDVTVTLTLTHFISYMLFSILKTTFTIFNFLLHFRNYTVFNYFLYLKRNFKGAGVFSI